MWKLTIVWVLVLLSSAFAQLDNDLYSAVYSGTLDDVRNALAAGGNPNWVNPEERSWTALHIAAFRSYTAVAKELLDAGAMLNIKDERDYTPIHYAIDYGDIDTVRILIDYGANVNIPESDYGFTPLMGAAYKGNVAKVRALLDANANVRVSDNDGDTALHLVARGSIAQVSPFGKKIPVSLADRIKYQDIAQLLLQKGADPGKRDSNGKTSADIARDNEDQDLANIIDSFAGPTAQPTTTVAVYDLYLLTGMEITANMIMLLLH